MLPAQAVGFAVAQYGLTSTAQMLSLGMSREAIRWYAKIGDLLPERRGSGVSRERQTCLSNP